MRRPASCRLLPLMAVEVGISMESESTHIWAFYGLLALDTLCVQDSERLQIGRGSLFQGSANV